jgi:chemotaxis protein methyltransferase WspC
LQRLLTANGVLFVGPSEAGLLLNHDFVSAKVPLAFALRKVDAAGCATARASVLPNKQPLAGPPIARPLAGPHAAQSPAMPIEVRQSPDARLESAANLASGIEQASLLADQGQFVEAAKHCDEHLRAHGPSTEAFHLMGLIRAAAGNLPESAEYYRKTLYLDPNHTQSLVHLALLLEKQGDTAGAKVLSDRLRRLDRKKGNQHGA